MTIGFAPVHKIAAKGCVDFVVDRAMRQAAIGNTSSTNATEDGIELFLPHSEAVVLNWDGLCPLIEVEREPLVDVDGRERAHGTLFGPGHAEKFSEQPG